MHTYCTLGKTQQALDDIDKREKHLNEALSTSWKQAILLPYSVLDDYTLIVVQLGLILLFSPVFPLAPLIAMLNNIVLIRFSAYKLCYSRRRPVAVKTGSIGVWEGKHIHIYMCIHCVLLYTHSVRISIQYNHIQINFILICAFTHTIYT